jgi:prepilin-type N-terminal cleavage/methylation domain-containing protein
MSRRKAFSLIELLISSALASILLLGLASFIFLPLRVMQHTDDISTAQTRAEMVFSILRQPLEQCGYGLPKDITAYKNAFGAAAPPFNWPGALSVENGGTISDVRPNGLCKITYAVKTTIRTLSPAVTSTDKLEVKTSGIPALLTGEAKYDDQDYLIKNWIVFGAMMPYCLPARQYSGPIILPGDNALLSLVIKRPPSGNEEIFVPENDALFYLRALECRVRQYEDDYIFATNSHDGSGWQPRIEGVIDVRFEYEEDGRLLRVLTLTRGKHKYNEIVTRDIPEGWPEKYAKSIPKEARYYRLLFNQASYTLKNL